MYSFNRQLLYKGTRSLEQYVLGKSQSAVVAVRCADFFLNVHDAGRFNALKAILSRCIVITGERVPTCVVGCL